MEHQTLSYTKSIQIFVKSRSRDDHSKTTTKRSKPCQIEKQGRSSKNQISERSAKTRMKKQSRNTSNLRQKVDLQSVKGESEGKININA